jgi:superoxide dismutase
VLPNHPQDLLSILNVLGTPEGSRNLQANIKQFFGNLDERKKLLIE